MYAYYTGVMPETRFITGHRFPPSAVGIVRAKRPVYHPVAVSGSADRPESFPASGRGTRTDRASPRQDRRFPTGRRRAFLLFDHVSIRPDRPVQTPKTTSAVILVSRISLRSSRADGKSLFFVRISTGFTYLDGFIRPSVCGPRDRRTWVFPEHSQFTAIVLFRSRSIVRHLPNPCHRRSPKRRFASVVWYFI